MEGRGFTVRFDCILVSFVSLLIASVVCVSSEAQVVAGATQDVLKSTLKLTLSEETSSGTADLGRGAIVWLEGRNGERLSPKNNDSQPVLTSRIKNGVLSPRVIILRPKQRLRIENADAKSYVLKSLDWSVAIKGGESAETSKAEFPFPSRIRSEFGNESWRENYFFVCKSPYFGVSDANGVVSISGVPPGEYSARVWKVRFYQVIGADTFRVDDTAQTNIQLKIQVQNRKSK
mgnify:CR=1 FL=1